jgi:hypothetical protein
MKDLYSIVEILRNAAEHLIPYNFPMNHKALEDDIGVLKNAIVEVDGYTIHLHFSRADYGEHYLESCQIHGENTPFLPFNLVVKIGQIVLGSHYLSFIETIRKGQKYYCWTVCIDKSGHPIPWQYPTKMSRQDYEGFQYNVVHPNEIKFH